LSRLTARQGAGDWASRARTTTARVEHHRAPLHEHVPAATGSGQLVEHDVGAGLFDRIEARLSAVARAVAVDGARKLTP